jgi:hypothetical protein
MQARPPARHQSRANPSGLSVCGARGPVKPGLGVGESPGPSGPNPAPRMRDHPRCCGPPGCCASVPRIPPGSICARASAESPSRASACPLSRGITVRLGRPRAAEPASGGFLVPVRDRWPPRTGGYCHWRCRTPDRRPLARCLGLSAPPGCPAGWVCRATGHRSRDRWVDRGHRSLGRGHEAEDGPQLRSLAGMGGRSGSAVRAPLSREQGRCRGLRRARRLGQRK